MNRVADQGAGHSPGGESGFHCVQLSSEAFGCILFFFCFLSAAGIFRGRCCWKESPFHGIMNLESLYNSRKIRRRTKGGHEEPDPAENPLKRSFVDENRKDSRRFTTGTDI